MNTRHGVTNPTLAHAHRMTCMEVFGGNSDLDTAVTVPGIDIFVLSEPWRPESDDAPQAEPDDSGGGDVTYISMCAAGRIARVVLADVSGHGAVVDDAAKTLRTHMRKNINRVDQSAFVAAINQSFAADAGGLFATAVLVSYDSPSEHAVISNAGHPRPLLYRAAERRWLPLHEQMPLAVIPADQPDGITDLPLGVIEPTGYHQFAVHLDEGDMVLLYTDAITETPASPGSRSLLGEQGLLDLLTEKTNADNHAPEHLVPRVRARIEELWDGEPVGDDCSMILLHHHGGASPPISLAERATAVARMLGLIRS